MSDDEGARHVVGIVLHRRIPERDQRPNEQKQEQRDQQHAAKTLR
jgi:hypothetical protein